MSTPNHTQQENVTQPPFKGGDARLSGGEGQSQGGAVGDSGALKQQTAKGLLWGGVSNGLFQIIGAVFGILLLNLLSPADYGKIAVLIIFSNIASNLQESGFIAALCNKRDAQHEDYNAVFWFNIIVAATIYAILWFLAPLIAAFYNEPALTLLSRVFFLTFVISAFGTVQRAIIFRNIMVKQQNIILLVALLVSNTVGVIMAWQGMAYWGLATQTLLYTLIIQLLNWYVSPWRPTLHINLRPAFRMFGFSSKLMLTNLFEQLNAHVFSVLLGKYYDTHMVGLYSNARKWNDMANSTIVNMLQGVAQPVLSKVTDDQERLRQVFRKMLRFTAFVTFPAMFGLALISQDFIHIVAQARWDEWQGSAPLLSLLCIEGAFKPVSKLFSNLTISLGRSSINMFSIVSICLIVWAGLIGISTYGLYAMIVFFVAVNVMWLFVWQYFAWRLIGLSPLHVMLDIMPFLCLSLATMAATYYCTQGITSLYLHIIAQIILAAVIYLGVLWLLRAKILRESLQYVFQEK